MANKIKYFIGCGVPVYSCNFRCQYCYLGQHPNPYSKGILEFSQTPEYIADFFSIKRMGGACYFNFCASGETLMHPQLIDLIALLTKEGHFADIITNGTLSKKFDTLIDTLGSEQRKHLMLKFSFHYLELKRTGLLSVYVENINKIKRAGISYSIEITPHDELIPYIDEIKSFSLKNFGALPHITVARNEATKEIELLTELSREEYKRVWGSFDSGMFDFKFSIFNQKRCEFCYAGLWSLQLSLDTGEYYQCYGGDLLGNIKNSRLNLKPIGKCRQPHCFNGHAYLTYGTIPEINSPCYIDMRDRVESNGKHWIGDDYRGFFSSKLFESNQELDFSEKKKILYFSEFSKITNKIYRGIIHAVNRKKDK